MKVAYINYAYNIQDMYECNTKLMILAQQKGMYKLHIKNFMKENKLTKSQMKANPSVTVPPLRIKTGLCGEGKILSLREIENEIKKT